MSLRDDHGTDFGRLIGQPKRFALLAYLAGSTPQAYHRRDRILGLFWPESTADQARHGLRQLLYELRKHLGEDVILRRGAEEIALNEELVSSDVALFHEALSDGNLERAIELYGGDFLDGVFVAAAPELMDWIERRRSTLRREVVEVAWRLAEARQADGDLSGAVVAARRAVDLVPTDEVGARRLIELLWEEGNTGEALRAYDRLARTLADDFEAEPSAQTVALVTRIREAGTGIGTAASMEAPVETPSVGLPDAPAPPTTVRRDVRIPLFGGATAVLFVVLALGALNRARPRPVARFDVTPPEGADLGPATPFVEFDLSRDGSRIVHVGASPTGGTQLWLRELNERAPSPIRGTEGAVSPALSPDGRTVAFLAGGIIRTLNLDGGSPVTLGPGGEPTWSSNEALYFVRDSVVYRIPTTGGEATVVTTVPGQWLLHPSALPDGRGLLFTLFSLGGGKARSRIAAVGPEGGEVHVIADGVMARYAPSGHLVYATPDGALMAVPFDPKRLVTTGPSVGLPERVVVKRGGAAQFALSETETLLFKLGGLPKQELVWVSRGGGVEPVDPLWTGQLSDPALSPDGSRLAVSVLGPPTTRSSGVWVRRFDNGTTLNLTLDGYSNGFPSWTPDGTSVTFASNRPGTAAARDTENDGNRFWTKRADGSGPVAPQLLEGPVGSEAAWSFNGEWLVYRTGWLEGDIMARRAGDSVSVPVIATAAGERSPALSPDGHWLAYTSDESGRDEVYVVPLPGVTRGKWIVSTGGGIEPVWAHSGREIFYRNSRYDMVSAQIRTTPTFSVVSYAVLFSDPSLSTSILSAQYDVSPDDQRFIMIRQVRGDETGRLILVQNFMEEPVPGIGR